MLGGDISDGDEDGDESSSALEMMPNQFRSALKEFREQWQKELKPIEQNAQKTSEAVCAGDNDLLKSNTADLAEALFVRGVELEKCGKVYDALEFYRKAIQIVPDIEFKWYESTKKAQLGSVVNNNMQDSQNKSVKENVPVNDNSNNDEDLTDVNLYLRFQNELNNGCLIKNSMADGVISTSKHISDLPIEILFYILRWVVSSQLDVRSLEQCSSVCKGLYLCARDDEIWRLICLKVWGINTGLLSNTPYDCWRDMLIERDRILFGGCYISKTTYLRYGENSFQDQFYRPVQLIEYYRYLRFLPDGTVIMWTTSEEPAQAVTKLKHTTNLRPEFLCGHYRLHGSVVTIILKRSQKSSISAAKRKSNATEKGEFDTGGSYTYYIELKITSTPKRRFVQLVWNNYSIIQVKNKREITSNFELTASKYPPLWFSKVKSYHLEAEYPLQ